VDLMAVEDELTARDEYEDVVLLCLHTQKAVMLSLPFVQSHPKDRSNAIFYYVCVY